MEAIHAKIILKDRTIDSMIEASNPRDYEPDDFEYLYSVHLSLKKLRSYLRKVSRNEINSDRKKDLKRST